MNVRIDKYLSGLGVCSRREVEKLLKKEQLTVNGQRVFEPGVRIEPDSDEIKLNGKALRTPKLVYYLLNKPIGIISTTDDEFGRTGVTALVNTKERVYPVGRLDRDTSGLILLTNDGELTNILTHPRYHIPKTYRLKIKGTATDEQLTAFRNGVLLEDGLTAPAEVLKISATRDSIVLEVTLYEGRNRQIRRMCDALGLPLCSLERIRFGPLGIGTLKPGEYRELSQEEIQALRNAALNCS